MSILVELAAACIQIDTSADYNPICEAKPEDFCFHGYLFGCNECNHPESRQCLGRTAKTEAMEYIRDYIQNHAEEFGQPRRSERLRRHGV